MENNFYQSKYNPDVLSCIANLSSDEVFTSPDLANDMLDLLPQDIFSNPNVKFLDPACKSGVLLREIAKRLMIGLEKEFPEIQERADHIFKNQLFGIAITELTSLISRRSLYCSKAANGNYSITHFSSVDGNIRYKIINHKWKKGKCELCGASRIIYERKENLETHAYEFIHTHNPKEIFNMKFDVIISNPPYQLSDGGGNGKSATAIYQYFVEEAKKLKPRYISMIIPSRWFNGGKGKDIQKFRKTMLNDERVRKLVDYENYKEVFAGLGGLAGGVCYFLWDRDNPGNCEVTNISAGKENKMFRKLNEYEFFIRQNKAIDIVRKVSCLFKNASLKQRVYARKPFDISSDQEVSKSGIQCYLTKKRGKRCVPPNAVKDKYGILEKYKLLVPKAPIAGQTDFTKPIRFYSDANTIIAYPGECCSETWLVIGAFDTLDETESLKSYLFTKVVRFLLLQAVISQNFTRRNFCFIPDLGHYIGHYTDEMLCKEWNITDDEWKYIDSRILSSEDHD